MPYRGKIFPPKKYCLRATILEGQQLDKTGDRFFFPYSRLALANLYFLSFLYKLTISA